MALARAHLAASLRPPLSGPDGALVLLSLAARDKPRLTKLAAALSAAGYRIRATHGTAAVLRAQGYAIREVGRLGPDGSRGPDMLGAITIYAPEDDERADREASRQPLRVSVWSSACGSNARLMSPSPGFLTKVRVQLDR